MSTRSHAGMYDRQLLARLPGSRSPYGMQHGSERRLLGRLLGPATMNSSGRRVRQPRPCAARGPSARLQLHPRRACSSAVAAAVRSRSGPGRAQPPPLRCCRARQRQQLLMPVGAPVGAPACRQLRLPASAAAGAPTSLAACQQETARALARAPTTGLGTLPHAVALGALVVLLGTSSPGTILANVAVRVKTRRDVSKHGPNWPELASS
jgi:hypothetical protein